MYHFEENTALLRARLSKKRFTHSVNVAAEAKKLAVRYGEDEDKAYFAGLMHDVCKELPSEEQEELMLAGSFDISPEERDTPKLWHGIAGAFYLQFTLGISDSDVLNAVRYHTVGRAGMSRLEEIVYLADLVSEERDYNGVEEMRKLAYTDLNTAMLEGIRFSLQSTLGKGGFIPLSTLEAYNQYIYCEKKSKGRQKAKKNAQ
ncbi:MAG: HD domain-containing protein [Ruminococcus sp.]|nr:HD domain-containing protein [Ruminococcus sp.]MBQ8906664.1 bis(5'-nucleosyl)-tetraphosphatase (symmetrical) YqeK [Ruminococcus sp.]